MSEMLASVQQFHEVPSEAKRPNYTCDPGRRRERGGPAPVEQSAAAGGREGGHHGRMRAPRRGGGRRALSGDGERRDRWASGSAGIGRRRRGGPTGRWRASWTRRGA
jgi:hypothetical protein